MIDERWPRWWKRAGYVFLVAGVLASLIGSLYLVGLGFRGDAYVSALGFLLLAIGGISWMIGDAISP